MTLFTRLAVLLLVLLIVAAPVGAVSRLSFTESHAGDTTAGSIVRVLGVLGGAGSLVVFGAIRLRDLGSLSKKFVQRASAAAPEYATGIDAGGQDWEANTKAAEDNYKTAVTQAAADGRFGRGVSAAGQAKYMQRAKTLGAQRFPTGVAAAEGDWARGFGPSHQLLAGLQLPPRRPTGDPGNQARANAVATALAALKRGK